MWFWRWCGGAGRVGGQRRRRLPSISVAAGTLRARPGQRAWCVPAAASGQQPSTTVEVDLLREAVLLPSSCVTCCRHFASQVSQCTLLYEREFADAGAAAPEGGLHRRLGGERRCGGDDPFLWAMWVARSGCRGLLVLAALRLGRTQIVCWKLGSRTVGGPRCQCGEGFFGRKLSAPAPTSATPAGVVTLLRAALWLLSPH